jgi:hypothetical protein
MDQQQQQQTLGTTNKRPREIIVVSSDDDGEDNHNDEKRVCLAPMQLLDLPDEMLACIQGFISENGDLVSFAQCCERLAELVMELEMPLRRYRAGILTPDQVCEYFDRFLRTDIEFGLTHHEDFEQMCFWRGLTEDQYVEKLRDDTDFLLEEEFCVLAKLRRTESTTLRRNGSHEPAFDVFPRNVRAIYIHGSSFWKVLEHLVHHGNRHIEPAVETEDMVTSAPRISCDQCEKEFPVFVLSGFYRESLLKAGIVCDHPLACRKFGRTKRFAEPSCLVPICGCCFTELE